MVADESERNVEHCRVNSMAACTQKIMMHSGAAGADKSFRRAIHCSQLAELGPSVFGEDMIKLAEEKE